MTSWRRWLEFSASQKLSEAPELDLGNYDYSSVGDLFCFVLALHRSFGPKLRFNSANMPREYVEFIENPVLPMEQLPSDFPKDQYKELGLRVGQGDLSDFVVWAPALRQMFQKLEAEPAQSEIRVLVVDDSPTIHALMDRWAEKDPMIRIVGHALDAFEAETLRLQLRPDVMTLDIHMPGKDGIQYLAEMMSGPNPQRVLMLSTIAREHAVTALRALELGAMDYLEKPSPSNWDVTAATLSALVRSITKSKPRSLRVRPDMNSRRAIQVNRPELKLILLGASTGGSEALSELIQEFPVNAPPTLIVQHIPPVFSTAFAKRLNELSRVEVVEASDGLIPEVGHVYVAPGALQMKLERSKDGRLRIRVTDDPPENRHKPSVDYMFSSAVEARGHLKTVAALLTGMGADGARQLLRLKESGVHTIAQDEATSVVFGMPGVAVELGAAKEVVALPSMAYHLFKALES
jgi:two-component system chemotaxis response regulator CheB